LTSLKEEGILDFMNAKTPMLRQYFATKARYPGVLLAMRVGDFYEFYGEDAEIAAREMEITLTGRDDGKHGRIPMAGIPYHSIEKYLARLSRRATRSLSATKWRTLNSQKA